MKALIVHPQSKFYGGAELVVTKLANYLTKQGVENTLITTALHTTMMRELEGTHCIVAKNRPHTRITELYSLWELTQQYMSDYDIVNAHNFPASLAAYPNRKPVVWICNEPPELFSSPIRKPIEAAHRLIIKHRIKNVVVADTYNARRFFDLYDVVPKVVPYGIDADYWGNTKQVEHDNFNVVQCGVFGEYKNQMASIRAIEQLNDVIPKIKLILVGYSDTPYGKQVRQYIRDKGLIRYVTTLNHIPRDAVKTIYSLADVLLQPVKEQGGWLAPFEALCAGVPIIVSKEFTMADIVREQGIGLVTNNYVAALRNVYSSVTEHRRLAERGRDWVKKKLTWEHYGERMLNLFQEVLNG